MPIGENALKRVENNGYSKVQSTCPDMENSVVEEAKVPAKKQAPKKSAAKSQNRAPEKNGFERFEFGQALPYWLL